MSYSSANIDYSIYDNYINYECSQDPCKWNFLNNMLSMGIFGVDERIGSKYDQQLVSDFSDKDIEINKEFLDDINKYGNPTLIDSIFLKYKTSPNNMRYIYHSLIILEDIKKRFSHISKINILEIGGGYGGLCVWLNKLSKYYNIEINTYTTVDLFSALNLQKLYTTKFNIKLNTLSSEKIHGIISEDLYCISNYAFSELNYYFQKLYYENIVSKCIGGFMVWNNDTGIIEINENMIVEDEKPNYGCQNKFIYF